MLSLVDLNFKDFQSEHDASNGEINALLKILVFGINLQKEEITKK